VNQYGGDEQRHDVSRPAFAVGDQSQHDLQSDDVPRIFRGNQHHRRGQDEGDEAVARQVDGRGDGRGLRMFAGAGGVPGLDEFIPDAEPPDEREREQRRFGDGDSGKHGQRADHEEQQNQESGQSSGLWGNGGIRCRFSYPRPVQESIGGGSAAEHGEQRLQGSQRHDTGIV